MSPFPNDVTLLGSGLFVPYKTIKMSHLRSISFKNYRIFNEKTSFELRPLTFLTGPNSSGKSSILKSLLLLKTNFNSDLQVLDFSGAYHNLGTFENTLNRNNKSDGLMTFGFEASISSERLTSMYIKQPVTTQRSVYYVLRELKTDQACNLIIELTYSRNERSGKLKKIEVFLESGSDPFLNLNIGELDSDGHSLVINHEIISKHKTLVNLFFNNSIRDSYTFRKGLKPKTYRIPSSFSIKENSKAEYFDEPILIFGKLYELFLDEAVSLKVDKEFHKYLVSHPLRLLLRSFASLVDNTEYLEAVRANTRRIYTNDSQGTSFNELILEYRSRIIHDKGKQFTNKWLKLFGIADEIVFDNIEGVATTIYLKKDEEKIALADLGYGITQFLPILLKISMEEPILESTGKNDLKIVKKLILLEEPETNLHPKLQSQLADFLLDAIKTFEVRFIVETHSEYLIRKTQVLTAEKYLSVDDTVIYYFSEYTGKSNVSTISINENGSTSSEFGPGFFDEAGVLKFQLLKTKAAKTSNS